MSVTSVAARLPLSSFPCYNNPPIIHASGKTRAPDSRPSAARGGFAFACAFGFRFGFASVCLLCCSVLSGRDYAANYTKVGNLSANCPAGRGRPHTNPAGRQETEGNAFFSQGPTWERRSIRERNRGGPGMPILFFSGASHGPAAVTRPAQGGTGLFSLADAPVPARSRRARRGFTQRPYYGMCCC